MKKAATTATVTTQDHEHLIAKETHIFSLLYYIIKSNVYLSVLVNIVAYVWLLVLQHFLVTTQFVKQMILLLSKKVRIIQFLLIYLEPKFQCDFAVVISA